MLRNLKSDGTPVILTISEGLYLYLSASGGEYWLGAAEKTMFSTSFSYTLSLLRSS